MDKKVKDLNLNEIISDITARSDNTVCLFCFLFAQCFQIISTSDYFEIFTIEEVAINMCVD